MQPYTSGTDAPAANNASTPAKDESLGALAPDETVADNLAMVLTRTLLGVEAAPVTVEVHLSNGLPCFNIVGLPETAIKESKERVRAAISNSGYDFPARRITVNLSPADLPKSGSQFDLPIAIGVLIASAQVPIAAQLPIELIGELALNGELRRTKGVLPCVYAATRVDRQCIVPADNAVHASLVKGATCYTADSLLKVCKHLLSIEELRPVKHHELNDSLANYDDLADVIGQAHAKRALEVAAAGGHNLLMKGPPGAGKSMLAQRLPGILPPLSMDEALACATIRSVSDEGSSLDKWTQRPFRSPHHSCSAVALIGGGSVPRPGEISLAHGGVLFLDEITEFTRHALEQLREPLETGHINIARANQSVRFPAACQLIAAHNPCKCGFHGDGTGRCQCSAASIQAYQSKLSGPLIDRIDLHVVLSAVKLHELQSNTSGQERSIAVRARVIQARRMQLERQACLNAHLPAQEVDKVLGLSNDDATFLVQACEKLKLSARGFYKVKKVARTIADIAGAKWVQKQHIAEALSYRRAQ